MNRIEELLARLPRTLLQIPASINDNVVVAAMLFALGYTLDIELRRKPNETLRRVDFLTVRLADR